jgi:hypothetical protein
LGKLAPIFLIVCAVLGDAPGCAPPRAVDVPVPPRDATRMSHAQHATMACGDCHREGQRPGHDHKPCDTCHRAAFLAAPGMLCATCHTTVTTAPLAAPLRPYPVDDVWQAEPVTFSHAAHMDAQKMEGRVGFHVGCADCHVRGNALARPDHATCARCHAPEAQLPDAPTMAACASCHTTEPQQRSRARLIRGDLGFDHARHRFDRRGTPIRCEQCHVKSATATGYADHAAPRVQSCVGCHDDTDRTPATMRMHQCETCHRERTGKLVLQIIPRDHLPATERPLDHTLAFRRDHADAARDSARCAACHTQMSGNAHDACDECHQTMKPADHLITWRELDHGTEAAADRDRCARCHVVEFCTACHAQRPRSHGFPGSFLGDHGPLARTNVRACITCHQESYCLTCHGSVKAAR